MKNLFNKTNTNKKTSTKNRAIALIISAVFILTAACLPVFAFAAEAKSSLYEESAQVSQVSSVDSASLSNFEALDHVRSSEKSDIVGDCAEYVIIGLTAIVIFATVKNLRASKRWNIGE